MFLPGAAIAQMFLQKLYLTEAQAGRLVEELFHPRDTTIQGPQTQSRQ